MRTFIIILLLNLTFVQLFGQSGDEVKYQFAKEAFKNNYQKNDYEAFSWEVIRIEKNTFKFGDKILVVNIEDKSIERLFEKGIFNPDILFGKETSKLTQAEIDTLSDNQRVFYNLTRNDRLAICCFEELEKLNPNYQTKRFKFWVSRIGIANPTEYYIEIVNDKATKETSIEDFIENSKMTFFHKGTLIL